MESVEPRLPSGAEVRGADLAGDLDDEAFARIRGELLAGIERPGNVFEHVWRPGDVLVRDNRAVSHGRTGFDPSEPRVLRRVTVRGLRPEAWG